MTHASLFTGIGAFDYAAEKLGITNVYGCDNDPFAAAHYKGHYPGSIFYDDVKTIVNAPHTNILTAGFPCQDISIAANYEKKQLINHTRSGLVYEAIRIIAESRPTFVVLENVPTLRSRGLADILREFTEIGYSCGWQSIPASAFGALHRRERCFIVGYAERIGWTKIISIFNRIIDKSNKSLKVEKSMEFKRTIDTEMESQTQRGSLRNTDGDRTWLHECLRVRAIGNSIYFPVAEVILQSIKEEINL